MKYYRHRIAAFVVLVTVLLNVAQPALSALKRPTRPTRPTTTRPTIVVTTTAPPTIKPAPVTGSLTVFAAASLSAAFTDMANDFEKANRGVKVTLNFAGSSTLVAQIQNGAPADVVASADTANMDKLSNAKLLDGAPVLFTRNTLEIVVPKGNPLRVKGLADLARPEVFVGLGAPGVPAGDYARQILARAGVDVKPKSLETNVKSIVNKAALREFDAGIVYVTDVDIDDFRTDGVVIPAEQNIIATYPIAAVAGNLHRAAATAFMDFILSVAGQSILAKYKFLALK